jgi:predicted short-subunit dehydrogenase-like oxidoreductase (DUF2520 family)
VARLTTIAIVGRSKVGLALAQSLRKIDRYELVRIVPARAYRYPTLDAQVLIVACKDDKLEEVSRKAIAASTGNLRLIVHLSGSRPSTVLTPKKGIMRLTLHPIQTFAVRRDNPFSGIVWMASSEEVDAIQWAKQFTKALGSSKVFELKAKDLPLYHSITVFGANFLVLLGGAVEELSEAIGQNPREIKRALKPLMEQVLTNVLAQPSHDVLSGPIRRKDVETIRSHQKALRALDPSLRKLYDAFLEYARQKGY